MRAEFNEYHLSNAILKARKQRGVTQVKLAKMVGCSENTIVRIEGGQNWPSIETLKRIAVALKIRSSYLLRLAEESNPENTDINGSLPLNARETVQ